MDCADTDTALTIALLAITLLGSYIPADIARRKGRDFLHMYFLSVFASPIVGLIIALCIRREKVVEHPYRPYATDVRTPIVDGRR